MARLPVPNADAGAWGDVLNDYLSQSLNADGSLKMSALPSWWKVDNTPGLESIVMNGKVKIGGTETDFAPGFTHNPSVTQTLLANVSSDNHNGHFAVAIQTEKRGTITSGSDIEGAWIASIANHSGATAPNIIAADIEAFAIGTNAGQIIGSFFYCEFDGAGTAQSMHGAWLCSNGSYGGGTVLNNYALYVDQQQNSNASNNFGVFVRDQGTGANNWAIRVEGGKSQFDGDVLMPNLPTVDPHVAGKLWNSAGTVKVSAG